MKIENSCQILEKSIQNEVSWCRIILKWTPERKGSMNSVLSVSPFVSGIFFSESALRIFLIFSMNLGDNMGQKMT